MIHSESPTRHIATTAQVAVMDQKPTTETAAVITFRVHPELAEHLTDEAWRQRRSRSDLIAEIVGDWCEAAATT